MTAEEFEAKVGRPPEDDDLERANCDRAGQPGHRYCGWCPEHDGPRFLCGRHKPLVDTRSEPEA